MSGEVHIERDGHIATVVFDHPARRNAISARMWQRIPEVADEVSRDDQVRVVILRGAGDVAFVAGADISEFERNRQPENAAAYDAQNAHAFNALASIPKPVIAMIHGFCIGGGVALALTADMRYAADDAKLGIPAARLGLGYSMGGIATLARLVGHSNARAMFFTAKRFSASEALQMGLLNAVYPKAELEQEVRALAAMIADNAPLTVRAAKLASHTLTLPPAARDEANVERAIAACYQSEDYQEGVSAFLEKRAPRFQGR